MTLKKFARSFALTGWVVLTGAICPANAGIELGLMGGLDGGSASLSTNSVSTATGSITSFVYGATSHFDLQGGFGLGLGVDLLMQSRGLFLTGSGVSVNYITVPVMLTYPVVPQFFRFGLGVYASVATSDVTLSAGGLSTTMTRTAFNWAGSDFGIVGSLRGAYPVAPGINLIADFRYMLGFTDIDTTSAIDTKLRNVSLMAGAVIQL